MSEGLPSLKGDPSRVDNDELQFCEDFSIDFASTNNHWSHTHCGTKRGEYLVDSMNNSGGLLVPLALGDVS